MFIDSNGVSYHGEPDGVDHDADADHVAVAEQGGIGKAKNLLCWDCAGGRWKDASGGSQGACQQCGKETYLRELPPTQKATI